MVLMEMVQSQVLSVIQFIIVIAIGLLATKILSDTLNSILRKPEVMKTIHDFGYEEPVVDLMLMMLKYVLYFITFIIALSQFGFAPIVFDVVIIIIALFIVVVLIYSLKDLIPNVAAGLYLNMTKSVKKGDRVTVGAYRGVIDNMNLMTTILKDETGRIAIIPNSNLTRKDIIVEPRNIKKKKHIKQ